MALVQKGNRYYAVVYMGTGRPRLTIPLGDNKRVAEQQHSEIIVRQRRGLPLPTACKTPFDKKVREFLTHGVPNLTPSTRAAYESRLRNHFVSDPLFGSRPLHRAMEVANIQRWVTTARTVGTSDSLVISCLAALGSMASWCVDSGDLHENPLRKVRKPRTPRIEHKYVLEPEQVAALIRATPKEHRPLITFMALSGVRPAEAAALDFASVGFATNTVVIRRSVWRDIIGETKTHKIRTIPLSPALRAALETQKKNANPTSDLVFPSANGGIMNMAWFARAVFIPSLRRAGLVVPDGSRSLYLLRRTVATTMLANGVSIRTTADLLGHDPAVLVRTYLKARQNEAEEAVSGLDANIFGEQNGNNPHSPQGNHGVLRQVAS